MERYLTLPAIHDFVQQVARYDSQNSDMEIDISGRTDFYQRSRLKYKSCGGLYKGIKKKTYFKIIHQRKNMIPLKGS